MVVSETRGEQYGTKNPGLGRQNQYLGRMGAKTVDLDGEDSLIQGKGT